MIERVRARELGIEIGSMETGRLNAITDVEGVGVGHSTLISGDNVRTGVTAIVPHQENPYEEKMTATVDLFNAFGKATGLPQIMFEGVIETPILLTETLNTWRVADSVLDYFMERHEVSPRSLNVVVGETNGGYLTDNIGRHVGRDHVFEAIDAARSKGGQGAVPEGNVGGGTPMTGYGFKGGIGTASRVHPNFTVGVLVQLNCGSKEDLMIDGVPVGRLIELPVPPESAPGNSIMMIVATDLDVNSRQLWKVAKRTALGLARTGSYGGNSSGDFTIAFSTGLRSVEEIVEATSDEKRPKPVDNFLNPVYKATVEATEEAIVNALFKAETMKGREGNTRYALPLDQVKSIFDGCGRPLQIQ
ncbi:MAG: P1 family peptidase [Candidatus Bathyarchaeota archaeon]|nr:MAG: P1 family peptidase [Candidatus Bathyarchaeota archaeon]